MKPNDKPATPAMAACKPTKAQCASVNGIDSCVETSDGESTIPGFMTPVPGNTDTGAHFGG